MSTFFHFHHQNANFTQHLATNRRRTEVFELTVSGDGGYGEIAAFMAGIGNLRESYLWRSVTINPDNANNPSFLMFNGTVKVVSVDDPELSEWLWRRGDEAVL